ncbi:MAG: hypothetical protein HQK87_04335 [Nitrospinae bacterium]|nr:hypothetical protein [Nitrospinota bacterium]
MDQRIAELLGRIGELEAEVERELVETRRRFGVEFAQGKARFEKSVAARQRRFRRGLVRLVREASPLIALTAPVVYSLIVPLVLLDLTVTIFQKICFPIYGLEPARRSDFVIVDRHRLPYLNLLEKVNCAYCGYGNGVIAYAREVAGRTERYWCGIKHARYAKGRHPSYYRFPDYGDASAWRKQEDDRRAGKEDDEA